MTLRKLPIGIQDFEDLRKNDYIYIDKTRQIYDLIAGAKPNFLSRPRRFGKSLLISTLHCLFRAKKELFKGLWIEQSDWDWRPYPVIRLDMSKMPNRSVEELEQGLRAHLIKTAEHYGMTLKDARSASSMLDDLIVMLSEIDQVVVLVDEYDKPLLDQIKHHEVMDQNREFLRHFYGILKAQDHYLKFIFLTGVTKFSKVSVFSGLNNLRDLTFLDKASDLLGYTREEIDLNFKGHLDALAQADGVTLPELHEKMKRWYNGYLFSEDGRHVYNPFSILNLFDSQKFRPHWFATGTPTFLLNLIKQQSFDLLNLEGLEVPIGAFETFDIERINILALMYQTGYLTITRYDEILRRYRLDFPNYEVYHAFSEHLINAFTPTHESASLFELTEISRNFLEGEGEWDADAFFQHIGTLLGYIPYDLYIKSEKHYYSLLYLIIKLAGVNVQAEVHTRKGRSDIVVVTKEKIVVFEFKLNQSAKAAMSQIHERKYYEAFKDRKLPIHLAGVNFNGETREIDDWVVETL